MINQPRTALARPANSSKTETLKSSVDVFFSTSRILHWIFNLGHFKCLSVLTHAGYGLTFLLLLFFNLTIRSKAFCSEQTVKGWGKGKQGCGGERLDRETSGNGQLLLVETSLFTRLQQMTLWLVCSDKSSLRLALKGRIKANYLIITVQDFLPQGAVPCHSGKAFVRTTFCHSHNPDSPTFITLKLLKR